MAHLYGEIEKAVNAHSSKIVAGILGLLVLGGCGGQGPLELTSSALEEHRSRWLAAGLRDYRYEYSQQCECLPALVRPAQVEVRGGEVTEVVYSESGQPAATDVQPLFPTIEDLFARIDEAIAREAAMLVVSYDPDLGYPTRIDIDYDAQIADDEISIGTRALEAL